MSTRDREILRLGHSGAFQPRRKTSSHVRHVRTSASLLGRYNEFEIFTRMVARDRLGCRANELASGSERFVLLDSRWLFVHAQGLRWRK